jgi:hypothetical protein
MTYAAGLFLLIIAIIGGVVFSATICPILVLWVILVAAMNWTIFGVSA